MFSPLISCKESSFLLKIAFAILNLTVGKHARRKRKYAKEAYGLGDIYEKHGLVGAGQIRNVYSFWNLSGNGWRLGGRGSPHTGGMDAVPEADPAGTV